MGNRKISQLPEATGLIGTDIIVVVNDGVTKRSDIQTLSDSVANIISGSTTTTGVTFQNNVLYLTDTDDNIISTVIEEFTGITVNGDLSANTVNAKYITLSGVSITESLAKSKPYKGDQGLTPLSVSGDSVYTGIVISNDPVPDSRISIIINGITYGVGDGVKTDDFFFSGDNGVTARLLADVILGDRLFFNGNICGLIVLDGNDKINLNYNVFY